MTLIVRTAQLRRAAHHLDEARMAMRAAYVILDQHAPEQAATVAHAIMETDGVKKEIA
jgi:hypothetical protein